MKIFTPLPLLHADEQSAYIGTYTGETGSKGIYRLRVDKEKGILGAPELVAEVDNPSFLAMGKDRKKLFAVSESSSKVLMYGNADGEGELTLLQTADTGAGPCHLALGHNKSRLLLANYAGGSVEAWSLLYDGLTFSHYELLQHTHASGATQRQQQPHAHGVAFIVNSLLAVPDLGADRVYIYKEEWKLNSYHWQPHPTTPWVELPPGSGPRQVVDAQWNSTRTLYVLNELSNTICVFDYNESLRTFKLIEEVGTLPPGFDGESFAAGLMLSLDGQTLYASNRGHDSIARFRRDPETGRLTFMDCVASGGKSPRHFTLMPGAPWMLVANQHGNNIELFRVASDGALAHVPDAGVEIPAPVCVVFE